MDYSEELQAIADAVNRLAAAIERLQPDQTASLQQREKAEADEFERLPRHVQEDRCEAWARDHGLEDVRAVKAIGRARVRSFLEISPSRFEAVRNCGEKTTQTICEWAQANLET